MVKRAASGKARRTRLAAPGRPPEANEKDRKPGNKIRERGVCVWNAKMKH